MIAVVDVKVQAQSPNLPLWPMYAYVDSPSSIRVRNVPKKIGDWRITAVRFVVEYPDAVTISTECVLNGGVWVGTIRGTSTTGVVRNGYTIEADGVDENGNAVQGYVLGKGDVHILSEDGTEDPTHVTYDMRLVDAKPSDPRKGETYLGEDGMEVWDGEDWWKEELPEDLAYTGQKTDISEFVNDVGYITASAIPSDVSAFNNDAGYITASAIPSSVSAFENDVGYITASAIPSDISTFNNDAGYITASAIPSNVSAFENDVGYLTASTFTAKKVYNDSEDQYVTGNCEVFKYQTVFSPWSFSDGGTREVEITYMSDPYPETPWMICGSDCRTLPYQNCFYSTKEAAETTLSFAYPFESSPGEYVDVVATRTSSMEWVLNASLATMDYVNNQIGAVLSESF